MQVAELTKASHKKQKLDMTIETTGSKSHLTGGPQASLQKERRPAG